MEMILIIALLASNVWLIRKVLAKPDAVTSPKQEPETAPIPAKEEVADIIGSSSLDITQFADAIKEAVTDAAKEAIPLIIKELGTPADAGLPDAPPMQVPKENLDDVFSNLSASELTGEAPAPAAPNAGGVNFEEMQTAMDVLKDKPHTPEDENTARRVLNELEGTELIEYVKLDPIVRKRILMIECRLPEVDDGGTDDDNPSSETSPSQSPRKIVFHADIDTTDIDAIDFNILH